MSERKQTDNKLLYQIWVMHTCNTSWCKWHTRELVTATTNSINSVYSVYTPKGEMCDRISL